ncbi:MAG: EamA family transporter, partial [Verrucomicrobiota bacterium]|nr:EamA family transporter [Verrucomicrobiota bacterium]
RLSVYTNYPVNNIVLILLSTFFTALGQVLFKLGMQNFAQVEFSRANLPRLLWQISLTPSIVLGFVAFGVGAVLWLFALAKTELSYAMPLASLAYIFVLLASVILFREPVTLAKIAGTFLVAAGIVLVSWK